MLLIGNTFDLQLVLHCIFTVAAEFKLVLFA